MFIVMTAYANHLLGKVAVLEAVKLVEELGE